MPALVLQADPKRYRRCALTHLKIGLQLLTRSANIGVRFWRLVLCRLGFPGFCSGGAHFSRFTQSFSEAITGELWHLHFSKRTRPLLRRRRSDLTRNFIRFSTSRNRVPFLSLCPSR